MEESEQYSTEPINDIDIAMSEQEQERERRRYVDSVFRQNERHILQNRFEINGKMYPLLTPLDLFKMANPSQCPLCLWHSMHTPCGVPFSLFNDCMARSMVQKRFEDNNRRPQSMGSDRRKAARADDDDDDEEDSGECSEVFERHFYPCFVQNVLSQPYYIVRGELVMGGDQKRAMRTWLEMQRIQNVRRYEEKFGALSSMVGLDMTLMAAESRQWWREHSKEVQSANKTL